MKRIGIVVLLALPLVSCSSTYDDRPQRPAARAASARGGRVAGALEMLPPDQWWRNPQVSASVNLTPDQFAALERLTPAAQTDDATRLERDGAVAERDLRTVLEAESPNRSDIVTAANRVKSIRDALFDRQVQLLASERTILTTQQWTALQKALDNERDQRRNRDGYSGGGRGRGGRGGWGGRGGVGGRGGFPGW